jgi:hypothetical protein
MKKLFHVGEYNKEFNDLLNINITQTQIYRSEGLGTHLIKRDHQNCLQYLDRISDIIKSPDYIGINPNEKDASIELIKQYDDNVLIGIKVDKSADLLYVSTMYTVQQSKLERRIHSGRIIKFK